MKIKCRPEDFRVEEHTGVPTGSGPFALYRLRKKNLGTPEAIDLVIRKLNAPREKVSYGGLKDRHAMTSQHLTILGGPPADIRKPNLQLKYLGQVERAFVSEDIAANQFNLTARELSEAEIAEAQRELSTVVRDGFPNYFDDQRFGSVGASGQFAAAAWCRGDNERALWLAVADPNDNDRPRDASDKRWLRQRWGDWHRLVNDLSNPQLRHVAERLADRPGDFGRALGSLRHDVRTLLVSAFQSHLWNVALSAWIAALVDAADVFPVRLKTGEANFHRRLDDERRRQLSELQLPLPSARARIPPGPLAETFNDALGREGLTLADLSIQFPRDTFFSKGERVANVAPVGLSMRVSPDDLYVGHLQATFDFALPRGAYATMLLKRLFPDAARRHIEEQRSSRGRG